MHKSIIVTLAFAAACSVACASSDPAASPWVSQIGGKGAEVVFGLTETSDGRVCAAGTFWSSARFGHADNSVLLTTKAAQDLFVACYTANGELAFARRFGAQRGDEPRAIAALAGGDIVVAGLFAHDLGLDPDTALHADGNADIFVMRLDSTGNTVWAKQIGGRLADSGNALAVAPDGNILLAGNFAGLMTNQVGNKTPKLNGVGTRDAVVVKLSPNGDVLWARRAGGPGFDEATAVAAGNNGAVLVAGTFRSDARIGNDELTSLGYKDVFLLALDANGAPQWSQHIGGTGQDDVRGLAVDARGRIHLAGNFQATLLLADGRTITSAGSTDVFLARFSRDGDMQHISSFGGALTDQVFSLAVTGDGGLWLSGHYQGDTDVAPGADVVRLTAPSPGNSSGFLIELDPKGKHLWSSTIGGSGMEMVLAVSAMSDGGAAIAGLYNADLRIPATRVLGNRGKTDVFIARIAAPARQQLAGGGGTTQFDW